MTVSRTGIISTGKMELKQKTVEKKKKKKAIRRAFYVQIWMVVCGSAVAIATHVSPLLLHARILSSCLALIHSFSPATIHFLKRKKPEQKDKIDDIRPCLCSCLQFSASFFFWPLDGSIEWSIYADAFTAIQGWHQDALFSCTQPAHRRFDDHSSALEWKIVT